MSVHDSGKAYASRSTTSNGDRLQSREVRALFAVQWRGGEDAVELHRAACLELCRVYVAELDAFYAGTLPGLPGPDSSAPALRMALHVDPFEGSRDYTLAELSALRSEGYRFGWRSLVRAADLESFRRSVASFVLRQF